MVYDGISCTLATSSTTTRGTTTANRRFFFPFRSCAEPEKLIAVLSLATPHPLFWRSVDNVVIPCKVLGAFHWFTVFFLRHIKKYFSGIYCWTYLRINSRWTSLKLKHALAQSAHRQIHKRPQARRNPYGKICYIYLFCALVITDLV